ncbi:MAG: hypothetical protein H7240_08515 [Glaciimonas sp.]|nr:hypothetical protein [Glaciimonas sp.]
MSPRLIVVAGIPSLHVFSAWLQPLQYVLSLKTKKMGGAAEKVVADLSHQIYITRVPMLKNMTHPAFMTSDGYHSLTIGLGM